MKIKLILFCIFCILVSGCSKQSEKIEKAEIKIQKTDESEYDILNDGFAFSRNFTAKTSDLIQVEKRMLELSKEVFFTKSSVLDQGKFLNQSMLADLLSSSSVSSNGLNMAKEDFLMDGDRKLPAMRNVISNITEMDFYDKEDPKQCVGISICLLVNTTVSDYEYNSYEISLDTARVYAEKASKQLLENLRGTDELKTVPILFMIYSLGREDESLPGVMVSKAFCENQEVNFTEVDERWMIFPSSVAEREDQENTMRMQALKEAVSAYTKETVTIYAQGHYLDQELDVLKVTVQSYSGSYQFNLGLVQVLANQCDEFGSLKMKLMIEIQYYDDVIFTICKQSYQEKCTILDLS